MLENLTIAELENICRLSDRAAKRASCHHELLDCIQRLSPEACIELPALMIVGRGDTGLSFIEAREHAARTSAQCAPYLAEKVLGLSSYLRAGLKQIGAQ